MAAKPLTGTKVFLMLVAFFGLVIGVNVTMMKLAIATLPGTDVDSPYAAGLTYDREISAAHDQAARNWQVSAHIERRADGGATLQVDARDAKGQPVSGLKFGGRLERPTDKRADLAVELPEAGIGIYRGNVAAVAPGQWDLVIEGEARGTRVFMSRNRVILN
ncbi:MULTISPECIES: FixH family protein [Bradyrhizobium]|uniref:FixH family protein n=1 Tax=Bradyrhizobium TaxID=374 RepID=UPI000420AC24|nr:MULTISPECIES: FixH family protein [Bradyrhizobium]QOG18082.1 nitrogen fixation protein FixH [Bradyrhizobium sp. SEMIA]UFW52112.1 FixH family protein [Bradyrhizobium arachidis]